MRRDWARTMGAASAGLAVLLLLGTATHAFINPNFTPVHIERNAQWILAVRPTPPAAEAKSFGLEVLQTVKGKDAPKKLTVDFTAALAAKDGESAVNAFKELLERNDSEPAFCAVSDLGGKQSMLMHLGGVWARLQPGTDATTWNFEKADPGLNSTFNGGTDMLLNAMRFMQRFPKQPIMATSAGVQWDSHEKLGAVAGGVSALLPVDADADGKLDLHAVSEKGGTLWLNKGDKFEPVTAFKAAQLAAVWVDLDGNGRPDCAGLAADGKLQLHLQDASGKFAAQDVALPGKLTGTPGLHVLQRTGAVRPDLIITGGAAPWHLKHKGGSAADFDLVVLAAWPAEAGQSGPGVCADFDGDGLQDLLWCGEKASLLLNGKADGCFTAAAVKLGMGPGGERLVCPCDLDGDGRAEALLSGGAAIRMVWRYGSAGFEDVGRLMGEPSYILQGGVRFLAVGDFNNDGLEDLFAGYGKENGQFFFNRGFRSYGICEPLKFKEDDLPGIESGQSAAAWGDFDGDGALDLVCGLANGEVYLSKTTVGALAAPVCVKVRVAAKCSVDGPVEVQLLRDGQPQALRTTRKFHNAALFGITEAAEYTVRWKLPGQPETLRKVKVGQEAAEIVIGE